MGGYPFFGLLKSGVSKNEHPSTAHDSFIIENLFYSKNGDVCKNQDLKISLPSRCKIHGIIFHLCLPQLKKTQFVASLPIFVSINLNNMVFKNISTKLLLIPSDPIINSDHCALILSEHLANSSHTNQSSWA